MDSEQRETRNSVTKGEGVVPELFDFGPDVERPADGPRAAVPPWLDGPAPAGETTGTSVALAVDADQTPEPVAVPAFARVVPAPRRRRRQLAADLAVVTAPAVIDGKTVEPAALPAAEPAPIVLAVIPPRPPRPAQIVAAAAPATADAPAAIAPAGAAVPVAPSRPRRNMFRIAQVAFVLGLGGGIGVYATGGIGFLENRTRANPPVAEASAWVLNNLAGEGSVLVPASLADTLLQNGQDSDALVTYPDGSAAELALGKGCCDYLVLIGAPDAVVGEGLPDSVRSLFARSRPTAEFRTDGGFAQIRQVLPGTTAQVLTDMAGERAALVATGKQLIATDRVKLSETAKAQILAGEVDPRVLLCVVAVALKHKVSIAAFPAVPGEDAPGILRRAVAYDVIDGAKVAKKSDEVADVKNVLAGQPGVYHPAGAEVRDLDGKKVLWVGFDAPSPFGLLTLK